MSVPSKTCFGKHRGQRRQRVADKLQRRRRGEAEDGGVLVRRVDRLEVLEHDAPEILQRLPDLQRREGDIGRGEGLAVVPGHALAQLEGDVLPSADPSQDVASCGSSPFSPS